MWEKGIIKICNFNPSAPQVGLILSIFEIQSINILHNLGGIVNFIQKKVIQKIFQQVSYVKNIIQKFYPIFFVQNVPTYSKSLYMNNFPTLCITYTTWL